MLKDGVLRTVSRSWLLALIVAVTVAATVGTAAGGTAERDRVEVLRQSSRTTGAAPTLIALRFSPQQLWHPSPKAIDDLHKCIDSAACVHKVMDQDGASTDAFEFYHLTGWFLVDIKDTGGPVMHQETMFRLFTTGG